MEANFSGKTLFSVTQSVGNQVFAINKSRFGFSLIARIYYYYNFFCFTVVHECGTCGCFKQFLMIWFPRVSFDIAVHRGLASFKGGKWIWTYLALVPELLSWVKCGPRLLRAAWFRFVHKILHSFSWNTKKTAVPKTGFAVLMKGIASFIHSFIQYLSGKP